jgi:hypothetical protein
MATKKATKETTKQDASFENGSEDSLIIDMDEVEEQSFENIPKGTYDCVIEACEYALSNSSGKPMWKMTYTITDGEFAGRKIFDLISFSEKAIPMAKGKIQRFAPEVLSKRFDPKAIADSGDLTGKALRVKTKLEEYEGDLKTKVANVLAPKSGNDGFFK